MQPHSGSSLCIGTRTATFLTFWLCCAVLEQRVCMLSSAVAAAVFATACHAFCTVRLLTSFQSSQAFCCKQRLFAGVAFVHVCAADQQLQYSLLLRVLEGGSRAAFRLYWHLAHDSLHAPRYCAVCLKSRGTMCGMQRQQSSLRSCS